jgi:hypothetical protein
MAKHITVRSDWAGVDDDAARNFEETSAAVNVRQDSSARTVENLAHALNHLLAKTSRPLFNKSQPPGFEDTTGATPLYQWVYDDRVRNNQCLLYHIVAMPRYSATAGNHYAEQWNLADLYHADDVGTPKRSTNAAANYFYDVWYDSFWSNRGVYETNTEITDGISTFNGYTLLSVNAEEYVSFELLDTADQVYCDPTLARRGGKVLADAAEEIRDNLHWLRKSALTVCASWAATSNVAEPAAPGNKTGAHLTGTAYVNLHDNASLTRNTDTPGATVDLQYAGRGTIDVEYGANPNTVVNVPCRVLAKAICTSDAASNRANVRFWGPNGFVDISVASNVAAAWYGDDFDQLYMMSNIAYDEDTAKANKIDVGGYVATAGDSLFIYGYRAWLRYYES